jgi:hypothetical protein
MNEYHITFSERKDQCCPPSSYRQVNNVVIMAESEIEAIGKLTGNDIEIKKIELKH